MKVMFGRGGYGQWSLGISFMPARDGGWARVGWEWCVGLGPWILKIYGPHTARPGRRPPPAEGQG